MDTSKKGRRVKEKHPFDPWAMEKIRIAREAAAEYGITVELAMHRAMWRYVTEIQRRFPDLDLPDVIHELGMLAQYEDAEPGSSGCGL